MLSEGVECMSVLKDDIKGTQPLLLIPQWENIKYQKEKFGVNETDSTSYLATFQTSILTFNVKTYIPQLKNPHSVNQKPKHEKCFF